MYRKLSILFHNNIISPINNILGQKARNSAKDLAVSDFLCTFDAEKEYKRKIYQMGMAFDKAGYIRRAKKDIDEVKSRFDVLHRTNSIDDELYEDVMKRADCIQNELDTLMETKKEFLSTD